MNSESELLDQGIEKFASLPGIGRKSALRMVLHVLKKDPVYAKDFARVVAEMREKIKPCKTCGNYTEVDKCSICTNELRDQHVICVVETIRDLLAIEDTGHYRGVYHVLGGLISPMDGVGPEDLRIASLIERLKNKENNELIMAISPTIDGETTSYYIAKKADGLQVSMSMIARGVSFGGELQYTDELTLSRSIESRTPYTLHKN